MRQTRNLYLREDLILGRIFAQLHTITGCDADIAAEIARLRQNRNVPDLIRFLHAHSMVIGCRSTTLALEPDKKSIVKPMV